MNIKKIKKIPKPFYFLGSIIIVYFITFILDRNLFNVIINYFYEIFVKVIPIFIIIFILMVIVNYFITNKFIIKHLNQK